jgi:hypothetical protein
MKDLFEDYKNQPIELKSICDKYAKEYEDYIPYPEMENFLKEVNNIGFTFDYGLDLIPFGLRIIGTPITELEGFEEYEKDLDYIF